MLIWTETVISEIHFNIISISQAFAELEDNTPGQIMGITRKTVGKSSESRNTTSTDNQTGQQDEPISQNFTQKAEYDDGYSPTDKTDTHEYRKEKIESNFYYYFGFIVVFLGFVLFMQLNTETLVEYERDKTLKARAAEAAAASHVPFEDHSMEGQNNAVLRQSGDILKNSPVRSI